jgi:hypothetical protein
LPPGYPGDPAAFSAVSVTSPHPTVLVIPAEASARRSGAASLEDAIDGFLLSADLSRSSARAYRQALEQLARELHGRSLEQLDAEQLEHAAIRAWGHLGAATWNRNRAVLGSFLRWVSSDDQLPPQLTPIGAAVRYAREGDAAHFLRFCSVIGDRLECPTLCVTSDGKRCDRARRRSRV